MTKAVFPTIMYGSPEKIQTPVMGCLDLNLLPKVVILSRDLWKVYGRSTVLACN